MGKVYTTKERKEQNTKHYKINKTAILARQRARYRTNKEFKALCSIYISIYQ